MVMHEAETLNIPAQRFFKKKMKCVFSKNEFTFSHGKLDVLAYDRVNKCFHVAEGKNANRISSVGHAVGQLVAYISMLQEGGFDFLNAISKEANLLLTDFTEFLENKSIKVCFYVVLPSKQANKILAPAELMLKNIGDFGEKIGILMADKHKCNRIKEAKPILIQIRKNYESDEFVRAIGSKFINFSESKILETYYAKPKIVQFKEKKGNPYLHFEVWLKHMAKKDPCRQIEIAFHLEWSKSWQSKKNTFKRAIKIRGKMLEARKLLHKKGYKFKYYAKSRKASSKLYFSYKSKSRILSNEDLVSVMDNLEVLIESLLPGLRKINWGRKKSVAEEKFL